MKNFFNWIYQHKYQIVVVCVFLLAAGWIYSVITGLQRDHAYETTIIQMRAEKDKQEAILKARQAGEIMKQVAEERIEASKQIEYMYKQTFPAMIDALKNNINKYDGKRFDQIDNYGSNDLRAAYDTMPGFNSNSRQ